jgi:hypothetical protein
MRLNSCPGLHVRTFSLTLLLFTASIAQAKIADCEPIAYGHAIFRSHANYIEAYDVAHQTLLWHTELFSDKYLGSYDPKIEEDVQWNIACVRGLQDNVVLVSDGHGKRYAVDKNSGSVMDSK